MKKVLEPTTDFPAWGTGKGIENPQGILLWRPVGFDCRTYTGLEKHTRGGHKQNLLHTRTQEKGAVTPQETDPHLAVNVQESLVKAWVMKHVAYGRVGGTECSSACMGPLEGGRHYLHYLNHNLVSGQTTGRKHSPAHQKKKKKKDKTFTEHGLSHQNKTQILQQSVCPIMKLT